MFSIKQLINIDRDLMCPTTLKHKTHERIQKRQLLYNDIIYDIHALANSIGIPNEVPGWITACLYISANRLTPDVSYLAYIIFPSFGDVLMFKKQLWVDCDMVCYLAGERWAQGPRKYPQYTLDLDKGVMDPHFHLNEAAEIKTQEEEVIIASLLSHMWILLSQRKDYTHDSLSSGHHGGVKWAS